MPFFPPNDTIMKTAYRGGERGFVLNHYPIWMRGLPAQYTDYPDETLVINNYALRSISTVSTLKHPSNAPQGSVQRLINYCETIAANEHDRELHLIQTNIKQLRERFQDHVPQAVALAEEAAQAGSLSTAYTWLMKYKDDIDEMKRQVQNPKNNNFQNISHMNEFWVNEFSSFVANLFEVKNRDYDENFILQYDDLSPEDLIDKYIEHVISSGDQKLMHGVEQIRNTMLEQLTGEDKLLETLGIDPHTKNLFSKANFSIMAKAAKKGKYKSIKTTKGKISAIAHMLCQNLARGMGQELDTAAKASNFGTAFNTGQLLKYLPDNSHVAIKGDVISYTAAEGNIDIEALTANMVQAISSQDWKTYDSLRKQLDEYARINNLEIFEVIFNVKGYQSRRNMQIAGQGTFETRVRELQILADSGAFPSNMIDKIIFLLYNTMQGCIFDRSLENLKLYLGIACVVWMFDDYLDIEINSAGHAVAGLNTVHVFRAGGNFYTLSELLTETINNLKQYVATESIVDTMFDIEITPPSFDAVSTYQSVVNQNKSQMNEALTEEDPDEGLIQSLLEQRWIAMRNYVGQSGQMGIFIKQNKIEELLGMFEAYLRS